MYTQNIDGLDFQVGIPDEKIINVHGTLGKIQCEACKSLYPMDEFLTKLKTNIKDIYGVDPEAPKESTNILCLKCAKPFVKPATVLYGSSLPDAFFTSIKDDFPANIDLIIVIGTSLTVSPANRLIDMGNDDCKRLVINMETVGESLGLNFSSDRDFFIGGKCGDSVSKLVDLLGWTEDFNAILPDHLKNQ